MTEFSGSVLDVAFSPDGELLAACGDDGVVRVWNIYNWQRVLRESPEAGALYAVAYTIKMTRKLAGEQDYVVGKLEGQWWSDEGPDLKRIPKKKWRWKLMIRTPELVRKADLAAALKNLEKKGKAPEATEVRLESLAGGSCVQMLHLGPYEQEWESISRMLAFAEEQNLAPHGRHHEIYISDPRRVPPERLKTILRLPVRRIGRAARRSG